MKRRRRSHRKRNRQIVHTPPAAWPLKQRPRNPTRLGVVLFGTVRFGSLLEGQCASPQKPPKPRRHTCWPGPLRAGRAFLLRVVSQGSEKAALGRGAFMW
jgi:hypothetical protein